MSEELLLASVPPGEQVIVRGVEGGRGLLQRLAALGIFPGTSMRVVRNAGPVIVDVKGQRLALGRGMVRQIRVARHGACDGEVL